MALPPRNPWSAFGWPDLKIVVSSGVPPDTIIFLEDMPTITMERIEGEPALKVTLRAKPLGMIKGLKPER